MKDKQVDTAKSIPGNIRLAGSKNPKIETAALMNNADIIVMKGKSNIETGAIVT